MNQQLLKKVKKMQEEMIAAQQEIEATSFYASSGGVVDVEVKGTKELVKVTIKEDFEIESKEDLEMLGDMIVAACNQAYKEIEKAIQEKWVNTSHYCLVLAACSDMKYPKPLEKLIESFQLYPGIGPKTAERLAFFTFLNLKDEDVINFSNNLLRIKTELKYCSVCGVITDSKKCQICSDFNRERKLLVVEGTKDVNVFEKTGQYFGRYHILNGLISPLNGVGPDDVNIQGLLKRIEDEKIEEIIIATSATIEGEMTALYIKNLFENREIKVYRIGYGLPAGGDIEYADEITLIKALEGRKEM